LKTANRRLEASGNWPADRGEERWSVKTGVSNIRPAGQNRPVARLSPAREMNL